WAVLGIAGLLVAGLFIHLSAMIIALSIVWPDAFAADITECIVFIAVIGLCSVKMRIFIPHLIQSVDFKAVSPPSTYVIAFRFIASAFVCVLTIVYCLAVIYFGLVLPGNNIPIYVVSSLWMLSAFPMVFFMARALQGIYSEESPLSTPRGDVGKKKMRRRGEDDVEKMIPFEHPAINTPIDTKPIDTYGWRESSNDNYGCRETTIM
ncbi:hypothetical protein PMAYCL1PPCAC_27418, partial [Pristionchus mayeri]